MTYKLHYNKGRIHCRVIRKRSLLKTYLIRLSKRLDRDAELFDRKMDNFINNICKLLGGVR